MFRQTTVGHVIIALHLLHPIISFPITLTRSMREMLGLHLKHLKRRVIGGKINGLTNFLPRKGEGQPFRVNTEGRFVMYPISLLYDVSYDFLRLQPSWTSQTSPSLPLH